VIVFIVAVARCQYLAERNLTLRNPPTGRRSSHFTFPDPIPAGKRRRLFDRFHGRPEQRTARLLSLENARRNFRHPVRTHPRTPRLPIFDEPAFSHIRYFPRGRCATRRSQWPIVSDTPGPGDGKNTIGFFERPGCQPTSSIPGRRTFSAPR